MTSKFRDTCLQGFVKQDKEMFNAFLNYMGKINIDLAKGKYTVEEYTQAVEEQEIGQKLNPSNKDKGSFTSTEQI
jgi:hypothetical protein